jgi:hypothetical protein
MLRATFQTGVQDLRDAPDRVLDDARKLLTVREQLRAEEARLAERRMDLARRYDEERVAVPREEFSSWFSEEET